MEYKIYSDNLLAATDPAKFDMDFSGWVNRIGIIAQSAGHECSQVDWNGSPSSVALSVIQLAESRRKAPSLLTTISNFSGGN